MADAKTNELQKSNKTTFGYIRQTTAKMKFFSAPEIPPGITTIIFWYFYIPPPEPPVVTEENLKEHKNTVRVKVAMLGDSQCGRSELFSGHIPQQYDEDYVETLGVNYMEKTIELKNVNVTITIWDLIGKREFATLFPLVCSDAKVILFVFDLTQKQSLFSVKRWYKEARQENKIFMPFLIGARFDLYDELEDHHKDDITKQARKFAKKMHAPLIYCSSAQSINVKKILKVVIAKVFDLNPKINECHDHRKGALIEFVSDRDDIKIDDTTDNDDKSEGNNTKRKKKQKKKKSKKKKKKPKKKKNNDNDDTQAK